MSRQLVSAVPFFNSTDYKNGTAEQKLTLLFRTALAQDCEKNQATSSKQKDDKIPQKKEKATPVETSTPSRRTSTRVD